jgi:P-type conjugative transfer protein TrbL
MSIRPSGDAGNKTSLRAAVGGVLAVLAAVVVLRGEAVAADANMVDSVIIGMQESAAAWGESLKGFSLRLFGYLAVISFVWNIGALLYADVEIGLFFEKAGKYIVVTGCYLFLVTMGPTLMGSVIATFFQMGGMGESVMPGEIMGKAFTAFGILMSKVVFPSTTESIWDVIVNVGQMGPLIARAIVPAMTFLVGVLMLLSAAVIAACLLLQIVKAYILAYCGYFYFAFGGCEWTRPMALNYFRSVLVAGAELLATLLAFTFFSGLYSDLIADFVTVVADGSETLKLQSLIVILFAMLLCACFIAMLPPAVSKAVKGVTTAIRLPVSRRNFMAAGRLTAGGMISGARLLSKGGSKASQAMKKLASGMSEKR